MLAEFSENLQPRVLGQLLELVFEKMELAGEAGSLLKIEEEIADAVEEARQAFNKELQARKDGAGYLPGMAPEKRQASLFDFTDLKDETEFWAQAEEMIIAALQEYADQAQDGSTNQRRLFARDAARGFAFIDLCRKRYDVVLMNPPFGKAAKKSEKYLSSRFSESKHDLALCMVDRSREILIKNGFLGAIITRTPMFLPTSSKWRKTNLLGNISKVESVADFGVGVLDAVVESAAFVVRKIHTPPALDNTSALFVRAIETKHKDHRLLEDINFFNEGQISEFGYFVLISNFYAIPFAPLSYWTPESARRSFRNLDGFQTEERDAKCGLGTLDDFRFLRLAWEPKLRINDPNYTTWKNYVYGGTFAPFYESSTSMVNWKDHGKEIKTFVTQKVGSASRKVQGASFYFKEGLTFPRRTKRFCPRPLPSGSIFSTAGQGIFFATRNEQFAALGLLSSDICKYLISLSLGTNSQDQGGTNPQFEVGLIKRLPWPTIVEKTELIQITKVCVHKQMQIETFFEDSRLFIQPLPEAAISGKIEEHFFKIKEIVLYTSDFFEDSVKQINKIASVLYEISSKDLLLLQTELGASKDTNLPEPNKSNVAISIISWLIGCIFGRWDIRIGITPDLAPKLPDPFDPLPVCPPGMLVGINGLPAEPNLIASEEWLQARPDANTLPPEGSVKKATIPDSEYPLRITWSGILVDDFGVGDTQSHEEDIIQRIREIFDLLWKDKAPEIEQEACEILGVRDLHEYFHKPTKFFQDHLKRYSKSRRKAPVYWPLSTESGSYTLWLYYHRLTDQTLFTCVTQFIDPKINDVTAEITNLKDDLQQESSTKKRRNLDELLDFKSELKDFREELLRIAGLPYKPNLNDGVMITAAPLRKLFRHRQWSNALKKCWQKLENGEYDWAHLAYAIWPERVIPKCHKDRSLAIAHGLEEDFWDEIENGTDRQGNSKYKWEPKKLSKEDIRHIIRDKTGK